MELAPRITLDQSVRSGQPVIRGTRVPVALVLGKLAGGMSYAEVRREYELAQEDILASLDYAASLIEHERVHLAV